MWETFEIPSLTFLKLNWTIIALELAKMNGMPISSGILRLSNVTKHLKLPVYRIKVLDLTEAIGLLKRKENGLPAGSPPPSHLRLRPCSLRLLEPLMLSDLPLPASLPPIPISLSLKLSPLRIPVNLRVHMFPGLKLTYDP